MSNVWSYFQLAANVANISKGNDFREFKLGAVGIRSDGVLIASANGSAMISTADRRHYSRECHAEYRLSRKVDKGAVVYVARINIFGNYKNARPCKTCENALRSRGVKKVYYTLSNNEYGVMILKKK